MKKIKQLLITLLFTLLFSGGMHVSYGQNDADLSRWLSTDHPDSLWFGARSWRISGHFDYKLHSNALTNSFVNASLYDGFIDDDTKDDVSDKSTSRNRYGYDLRYGFSGSVRLDSLVQKSGIWFTFGIQRRNIAFGEFSEDFFEVAMRGNKAYANQNAELGPFKYTFLSFRQLSLGVEKYDSTEKQLFGGSLNLLQGSNVQQVISDRADMFTEANGAYIDFTGDVSITYTQTDEEQNTGIFGGGGSIDLYYMKELKSKDLVSVQVRDLGFVYSKSTRKITADSSYRWDGVTIRNIFEFDSDLFDDIHIDSLTDVLNAEEKEESAFIMLPAHFEVNYLHQLNIRWKVLGSFTQKLNASYIPRLKVQGIYEFPFKLQVMPSLAYGGWSAFDVGLGLQQKLGKKWLLSVHANYFENWLIPETSTSQSFSARISGFF